MTILIVEMKSCREAISELPFLSEVSLGRTVYSGKDGPLVFLEEHANFGFDLVLFIFKNGVNRELGLGTTHNFKIMHSGPHEVLADKKQILRNVTFPFQKPLTGKALRKQVEQSLT